MTRGESIIIDTKDGIAFYRLAALNSALSLQEKGMRLSRNAPQATAIGKRDYGLKGTAATQHKATEAHIEDIHTLRAVAPAMQEFIGYQFALALNGAVDAGKDTLRGVEAEVMRLTDPTPAEKTVILAMNRVYWFERGCHPAVRVVFRED
jgi:hypothetical protein